MRSRSLSRSKARFLRAELERLEERALLSLLPTPTTTAHVDISPTTGNHSSPSIAVDPLDPTRTVSVWTRVDLGGNVSVEGAYSTDGGHTWSALTLPAPIVDPVTNQPYASASDASAAFDRSGNFYVLESEHSPDQTSGALVIEGFQFKGAAPVLTTADSVAHQWLLDQALNPTLAVDSNVGMPVATTNLSLPTGLAFGPDNNLYVGNQGNGQIQKFNGSTGGYQSVFASSQTLVRPGQMTFDAATGTFLVVDQTSGQILQYDATTGASRGLFSHEPTAVSAPTFTTIGPDGYIYLSNYAQNDILRYDPKSGLFHGVFVRPGSGGLQGPMGLAFGTDNDLYVVSSANNEILRYDGKTGEFLNVFAANNAGGTTATSFNSPSGLTLGPDGNFYVANFGGNTVLQIGRTGNLNATYTNGFNGPNGLTFGPDGLLYVANSSGKNIFAFNPGSTTGTRYTSSLFQSPFGAAFSGGKLYVTDSTANVVFQVVTGTSPTITTFIQAPDGGLSGPEGLAFGPSNSLFVVGNASNSLDQYDSGTGAFVRVLSSSFAVSPPSAPGAEAIGPDGLLYVISHDDNSVLRYDPATGAALGVFITPGEGGLADPQGLAFSPDGSYLYVTSAGTNGVMRYSLATGAPAPAAGQIAPTATFITPGLAGLSTPVGITVDSSGRLYVSSYANNSVLRYNPAGGFDQTFVYSNTGGLNGPTALTFGPDGNLYVASFNDDQIYRFDGTNGSFLNIFVSNQLVDPKNPTGPLQNGGLSGPLALAFGPDGNLYVSSDATTASFLDKFVTAGNDQDNRVLRYSGTTGAFLGAAVDRGAGGLSGASGLTFGGPNNTSLFVSSRNTNRVLQFSSANFAFQSNVGQAFKIGGFAIGPDVNGDGIGEIFASASNINGVVRYDGLSGDYIDTFISPGAGGLSNPGAIVYDAGRKLFYVASIGTNQVLAYSSTTGQFVGIAAQGGGLNDPEGLAIGADGDLYVSSAGSDSVLKFDPTTGQMLSVFVSSGSGGLKSPRGLSFGPDGHLFVAAFGSNQILEYDGTTGAVVTGSNPDGSFANAFPAFRDPSTGVVQNDPYSGNVYVSWVSGDATQKIGAGINAVYLSASSNGGRSFGAPVVLNTDVGQATSFVEAPKLTISQGNASGTVAPGQVTAVWDNYAVNASLGLSTIESNGVAAGTSASFTQRYDKNDPRATILDPPLGGTATTVYPLAVNVADPRFATLGSIDVRLSLIDPDVTDLRIELVAPNGARVNLISPGDVTGANLGIGPNKQALDTVFTDTAPRSIVGASAAQDYVGYYVPDRYPVAPAPNTQPNLTFGLSLSRLIGLDRATINGIWKLEVTDVKNDNAPKQYLVDWGLDLNGGLQTTRQQNSIVATTAVTGLLFDSLQTTKPFPTLNYKSPIFETATPIGYGPAPVIASDNTLGSFSPYSGRLYASYVVLPSAAFQDSTNIALSYSDDGGATWKPMSNKVNDDAGLTDGFSESYVSPDGTIALGRAHFEPNIAVDPSTGTLALSWYDARNDAARARVATYLAVSEDGGQTFAPQTFANAPNAVFDAITQKAIVLGPIPDNQSPPAPATGNINTDVLYYSYGTHQGLAFYNGRLYPVWSGNLNGGPTGTNLLDIYAAPTVVAAGPRVLGSTMGPVHAITVHSAATGAALTFNGQTAADGTPIADGFVVTFDRAVDPSSFTIAQASVVYRDVNTNGFQPGVTIPILSVTPLAEGSTPQGPTEFLVGFAPSSGVGTYSYSVGPNIQDSVRWYDGATVRSGHLMDQNANAVAGESADAYNVPGSKIPGTGKPPFDPATLPLIVPGPSLVSTQVPGSPPSIDNLTTDRLVNAIDATFDRQMLVNSFTPSDVLNIIGPVGGISTAGVSVLPSFNAPISAPISIPNNPNTPLSSSLNIPDNGQPFTIASLQVRLDLSTTNESGITVNLIGPDGTAVQLFSGVGFNGRNFQGTTLSDSASIPIAQGVAPFDQVYRPSQSLNTAFAGKSLFGVWTLQVVDTNTGTADTLNSWSLAATTSSGAATAKTFRIELPRGQSASGTYAIGLASNILAANGNPIDANQNAGLSQLFDLPSLGTQQIIYNSSDPTPPTIGGSAAQTVTTSIINVPDQFVVQGVNLTINVNYPHDPDLIGQLIAPDGTAVTLFTTLGQTGTQQNFTNTTFSDSDPNTGLISTPIQNGGPPFFGVFAPQKPLAALNGIRAQGQWKLVITKIGTSGSPSGSILGWILRLNKPLPSTGLGEPVADQQTASFRIFTQDPTNPLSSNSWTAVGPAGIGAKGPGLNAEISGSVTTVVADPVDPSGNTVYLGASGGGIWKTTNFLTKSAAGPTWTPLMDFGPTFATNISSIALYDRNGDPNQTIVLAATGDGNTLLTNPPSNGNGPIKGDSVGLTTHGFGFLMSPDGGKTWSVLDSTKNFNADGSPIAESQRDHMFVGATTYKVVIDPTIRKDGNVFMYAAVSDSDANGRPITGNGRAGGLWRSLDSGKTWTKMLAGQATDVSIDLNSGTGSPTDPNLQLVYTAIRGVGVYMSPDRGQVNNLMLGGIGDPLIQTSDVLPSQPLGVLAPVPDVVNGQPGTPNGPRGRIVLGRPALTGNPQADLLYQGWLYAAVVSTVSVVQANGDLTSGGHLDGLFMTKDFGQNWTRVQLNNIPLGETTQPAIPTNDTRLGNIDPLGGETPYGEASDLADPASLDLDNWGMGNFDIALSVDPTNPNIVYIGGTNQFNHTGLIRIDTTGVADAHAFYLSQSDPEGTSANLVNSNKLGGRLSVNINLPPPAPGPVQSTVAVNPLTNPAAFPPGHGQPYEPFNTPFINLISDPNQPFLVGSTILTTHTLYFANTGANATWTPFDQALQPDPFSTNPNDPWALPTTGVQSIFTMVDPATGRTRLLIGDQNGVYSVVDRGNGTVLGSLGAAAGSGTTQGSFQIVNGSRNGNLQIAQLNGLGVEPSLFAAQMSFLQGMFYASTNNNGSPSSSAGIVSPGQPGYGNISWTRPQLIRGTGQGIGIVQTGPTHVVAGDNLPNEFAAVYEYKQPASIDTPTSVPGIFPTSDFLQRNNISRTRGLIQSANIGDVPDPQWPFRLAFNLTVNPLNGAQVLAGSFSGGVFLTENEGKFWNEIGNPGALDGTNAQALTFGAPDPNGPGGVGNLDNYLLAGTVGGKIFVTFTGGGGAANGNQWTNISAGLDGSAVQQIVTDPTRGGHDAYAVTRKGVYVNYDTSASGSKWINITNDLFTGAATQISPFGSSGLYLQNQPRDLTSLAVDWRYIIPDVNPPSGLSILTHPVLYVGGDGGVYRTINAGDSDSAGKAATHWTLFPDAAVFADGTANPNALNNSPLGPGGGLPNALVTSLNITLGYVDPTTGRPDNSTGPNILTASTYGRGAYTIRLAPLVFPQTVALDPALPNPNVFGGAGSDTGYNPATQQDAIIAETRPVFDGLSEQSAFGNVVYVTLYDLTDPIHPKLIGGYDPNDASTAIAANETDPFGKFAVQVNSGVFDGVNHTTDGAKVIGIQATNASGTKGNMVLFRFTLDTIKPNTVTEPAMTAPVLDPTTNSGFNPAAFGLSVNAVTNFAAQDSKHRPIFDVTLTPGEPGTSLVELIRDPSANDTEAQLESKIVASAIESAAVSGILKLTDSGPISNGVHTYEVRVIDPAGNIGPLGAPYAVLFDTVAPSRPSAPILDPNLPNPNPNGGVGSDSGLIADPTGQNGGLTLTNISKPNLSGGAEPNTVVELVDASSGSILGPLVLNAPNVGTNGFYSVALNKPLADGTYTVYAQALDAAGNVSLASNTFTFTVNTAKPTKPTVSLTPADNTGAPFGHPNVTNNPQPHLYGRTDKNDLVDLFLVNAQGNPIQPALVTVTADPAGNYLLQFPSPLADGTYKIVVQARDLADNISLSNVYTFTVQQNGPKGTPSLTLASQEIYGPAPAGASAQTTLFRQPTFFGSGGDPGTTAYIYTYPLSIPSTPLAQAPIDKSGNFSFQLPFDLTNGVARFVAVEVDNAGNFGTPGAALTLKVVTNIGDYVGVSGLNSDYVTNSKADLSLFNTLTSTFKVQTPAQTAAQSVLVKQFGQGVIDGGSPIPIQGDYLGTGITDLALFQPSTSTFYIEPPNAPQAAYAVQFGQGTLYGGNPIPIAGDFGGDGRTDIAVYQPSTSTFYIIPSDRPNQPYFIQFGQGTLYGGHPIPVVGDFTHVGHAQLAVFEPSTSTFFIEGVGADQFGQGTLYGGNPIPLVGNFTGAGGDQIAVFQPSTSTFYIQGVGAYQFGQGTLYGGNPIPVVNDYAGHAQTNLAVYQPGTATFFVRGVGALTFGNSQAQVESGDVPIAGAYATSQGMIRTATVTAAAILSSPSTSPASVPGSSLGRSLDLGGSAARFSTLGGAFASPSQTLANVLPGSTIAPFGNPTGLTSFGSNALSGRSAGSIPQSQAARRPAQLGRSPGVDPGRTPIAAAADAPADDLLLAAFDHLDRTWSRRRRRS